MTTADQQFCLRWNNHQSTLISVFDSLLENGVLVDCTLAAEGQYLKAHKVVLSACSPYLETLLSQHYEKHPIVILKDVKFTELKSMMDYMYRGEVNISQDQLGTFLKAAESLQIKGLSDNGDDARDVGSTSTKRQDVSSRTSVTEVRSSTETKRPAPSNDDVSRDGSISPSSLRKRRRTRRPSSGDDPDLDSTNNSCDLPPNLAQSTPLPVPSSTIVPTSVQSLPKQIVKQEPGSISSVAPESGLLKEKIEPPSEPLLEPKTEYLDYMNNENSIEVEDLTLDDDEEELNSSMDASRPGPSHGDMSNQGYPPWTMTGDQSGTDEIFMAAQQAVGAATGGQRDSQDLPKKVTIFKPKKYILEKIASPRRNIETVIKTLPVKAKVDIDTAKSSKKDTTKLPLKVFIRTDGPSGTVLKGPIIIHGKSSIVDLESESGEKECVSEQTTPKKSDSKSKSKEDIKVNTRSGVAKMNEERQCDPEISFESERSLRDDTLNDESDYEFEEEIKKYTCKSCKKKYRTKETFMKHKKRSCGEKRMHECLFCPYTAPNAVMVRVHISHKHGKRAQMGRDGNWTYM